LRINQACLHLISAAIAPERGDNLRQESISRQSHRFPILSRKSQSDRLLGATIRSIITILNTWRSADLVAYDADRALLTVKDIAAMRAIVEANHRR
jgi:CRP/FNR family transcriptional regulator, cyclic AMP receptor protein